MKHIVVKECYPCPYLHTRRIYDQLFYECKHMAMKRINRKNIFKRTMPDWCPLEEYEVSNA